jgi:hypothetical protein
MALAGARMRQLNHATCVMAFHADRREARGLKAAWAHGCPGQPARDRGAGGPPGHEQKEKAMNTPLATSRDTALALWQGWAELWNGDLSRAEQILASGFTVNAAIVGVDGAAVQGARGVAFRVALLRKALGEPAFTVEVGPVIDGNLICGPDTSTASTPAACWAPAAPGSRIDFTGTYVLRFDNGLLAEYWLNSDVHVMAAQLGMTT